MVKEIRKKGKIVGYKPDGRSKVYKISVYGEQAKKIAEQHE
jgi:hypothetical protein